MTFYDNANLNEIIKSIEKNKNNFYKVTYLDGNQESYFSDEKHLKRLEKIIIEQATKRDEELFEKVRFDTRKDVIMSLLLFNSLLASIKLEDSILLHLSIICLSYRLFSLYENNIRLKELKKYRVYLKLYKIFESEKENSNIDNFEILMRKAINLCTLDNFNLQDIKKLKKIVYKRKY